MTIVNMKSYNGNPVVNQILVKSSDKREYYSYGYFICSVDYRNKVIKIGGKYDASQTTGKYRNKFLTECGMFEIANLIDLRKAISDGEVSINGTMFNVEKC